MVMQAAAAATAEKPGEEKTTGPEIEVVEEGPEKPKKITDKKHPDYVRCKSEAVIGSRAKRKRTCMTNKEWALVSRRGNEASRDFIGDNQPGFGRIPGQN
ncbi:MAG: hypothetical protein WBA51_11885 [Erythrobacter sp.]